MKRRQRVVQRSRRPAKPERQTRNLAHPAFDEKVLAEATYLTVPEVVVYGHFKTKNAAYVFLCKWGVRLAAGRLLRREFDRAWALAAERKVERTRRRAHGYSVPRARTAGKINSVDVNGVA